MHSLLIPIPSLFFLLAFMALAALTLLLIAFTPQRTLQNAFYSRAFHKKKQQHPFHLSQEEAFWVSKNWLLARNDYWYQLRGQRFYKIKPFPRDLYPFYAVRLYSLLTHKHFDASQMHHLYVSDEVYNVMKVAAMNIGASDRFPIQSHNDPIDKRKHHYFCPTTAQLQFKKLSPTQQEKRLQQFIEAFKNIHLSPPPSLEKDYVMVICHTPFLSEDDMQKGYAGGARLNGRPFLPQKVAVHIALNNLDIAFLDKASMELQVKIQRKIAERRQGSGPPQELLAESITSGYRRELAASLLCAKLVQWIRVSASKHPETLQTPTTTTQPIVLAPAALNTEIRQRVAEYAYATHKATMQKELTDGIIRYKPSMLDPIHASHIERMQQSGRYNIRCHKDLADAPLRNGLTAKHLAISLLLHGLKSWKKQKNLSKPSRAQATLRVMKRAVLPSKARSHLNFEMVSTPYLRFFGGHQLVADVRSVQPSTKG